MRRLTRLSFFSLLMLLFSSPFLFAQTEPGETLTIATCYPSPYGYYKNFDTFGETHLASEGGNVGIGTTNPQEKLDVIGGIKLSNTNATCDSFHPSTAGTVQYNSGILEYCDGTQWKSTGGGQPKAWVSFDGTVSPVTINSSYGVSSVQKYATGMYIITWSTPFPNANYIVVGACNALGTGGASFTIEGSNKPSSPYHLFLTNTVQVGCRYTAVNDYVDSDLVMVIAYPS